MATIEDLLATLYGAQNQDRVSERAHATTSDYLETVSELLRVRYPNLVTPKLISVSTIFKKPQSLKYDKIEYVVFDQRISRTLGLFNSFVKNRPTPDTFFLVMYILLAERHFIAGRFREAAVLCMHGSSFFSDATLEEMNEKDAQMSFQDVELLKLQEFFVLVHELAHTCVRTNPELAHDHMNGLAQDIRNMSELVDGDIPDISEVLAAQQKRLEDWLKESQNADLATSAYRSFIVEAMRTWKVPAPLVDIAEDPGLLEEAFCDLVALTICSDIFGFSEKVIVAGASALHHMRFFELLDSYLPGQPARSRQEPNVRLRLFRFLCYAFIAKFAEKDRNNMQGQLNRILELCSERLTLTATVNLRPDMVIARAEYSSDLVEPYTNRKKLQKMLNAINM